MPSQDIPEIVGSISAPAPGRDIALVGRDAPLEAIGDTIFRAITGSFRMALITGAGGVGKTRLLGEALREYADVVTLLSARCYRWGSITSFGPWIDALDLHLRGRSREEILQLCGPSLRDLAPVLRSVERAIGKSGGDPDRRRLLDALTHLLENLSCERPVVLAFDDVHLADSSAWEAFRYLGRRLSDSPIAVLAAGRPSPLLARPISREVIVGLNDDGILSRIELKPLTRSGVATLAHHVLRRDARVDSSFIPDALVGWLMARSLGHPLFVIGLLDALAAEGADLSSPRLDRLPSNLADRVTLDLQMLEPDDLTMLETLAVVDQRMDIEGLARISGTTLEQVIPRVDELSRGQFVHTDETEFGVTYEISHPIFQEAIYESAGHARRQRLHRLVARDMLENGQLGIAASHFARAGDVSEEAVNALFEALRQANARELYQEALAVLKALLDALPPMDERWVRLLESLTLNAEWVLSHLAEDDADTAIEAIRRVIEVLEDTSDVGARALAQFHLAGFLCFGTPDLAAAENACRASLRLFRAAGDLDGELFARNELAWIRAWQGQYQSADDLARAAFGDAIRRDRNRVAIVAIGTAAFVNGVMGRHGQSRALFDRTLELARGSGQSYRVAWALAQGGHYLALTGDLTEAVKWGEKSFIEDAGAADAVAFEDLASTYWLQGDLEAAIELLERSAIRRPILGSQRRAWGSALAARLHGESGRLGIAMSRLESASATYDHGLFIWSAWSRWSAGWLAWVNGDGDAALTQLDGLSTWLVDSGAWGYVPLVLADISEIAADRGRTDMCIRAAHRSARAPKEARTPLWRSVISLVAARSDLANGQQSSAVENAAIARDRFESAGYGLLAAQASQALGEAIALSDRGEAISHLHDAASEFDAQGAVHRRDRALTQLQRMGGRGKRAVAKVQGPGSLTPREQEVASFSAQGLTAYEVGEKLFISKRTVETHLVNIYAKLGIDSKRELIIRGPELDL